MAQWLKVLESDNEFYGSPMVEGKNPFSLIVLWPPHMSVPYEHGQDLGQRESYLLPIPQKRKEAEEMKVIWCYSNLKLAEFWPIPLSSVIFSVRI